jgi:DNA-binding NtrC family response regulator
VTANPQPRILIADDQADVLEALRLLLKPEGYAVQAAQSPAGVLAALESADFDVVVIDLNYARDTTSGAEGLDLLARIREMDAALPVVLMTAWGSIELAVEGMRRGARDFVQKPWDNARLLATLATQVELARALRQSRRLEEENRLLRGSGSPVMIAEAPAMQPVLQMIARVGPSDASVLITGESGVGKGLVAQALHTASERSGRPFVAVNTGGLSEALFESEFFGHVKGAYTDARADRAGRFELADGGTLFLDEIANVPLGQQAKLLRAIETGEYERVGSSRTRRADIRLMSATNADLAAEAAAGRFREDLLFRINTVEIHVPPLRQRREDIPLLAAHFLKIHAARYRKNVQGFAPEAVEAMMSHRWPGNVRELDHAVERAVLMSAGEVIRSQDMMLRRAREGGRALEEMSLEEVESFLIQKTLARFSGNVSRAAEALGLSRSALYRRLERYGL